MKILRKRSRRNHGIIVVIDVMPMIGRSCRVVIVDLDGILFRTRLVYYILNAESQDKTDDDAAFGEGLFVFGSLID